MAVLPPLHPLMTFALPQPFSRGSMIGYFFYSLVRCHLEAALVYLSRSGCCHLPRFFFVDTAHIRDRCFHRSPSMELPSCIGALGTFNNSGAVYPVRHCECRAHLLMRSAIPQNYRTNP